MVLIHEFGHYCVGRMLNFKINEFSVGFGKALISRKNKRGELISLRIFPLGGYCAFDGEEDGDLTNPNSFNNQKPWKRILVFLAGVTFNFATAVIFSLILLCSVGYDIPQVTDYDTKFTQSQNYVSHQTSVYDEANSFQKGDVIISINGEKIDFAYGVSYSYALDSMVGQLSKQKKEQGDAFDEESAFITNNPTFTAVVKRNGELVQVQSGFYQIKTSKTVDGETQYSYSYRYCINSTSYKFSFVEGLRRAVPFAFSLAWVVLKSLWLLLTFQLPISAIGGPITTITTIATFTQSNILNLLILIPLISANLAVFNILPIPALDGSHVLFTAIEAIRKKPIKREIENLIHTIGLFVLLGAVIIIDILHFLL